MDTICGAVITGVAVPNEYGHNLWGSYYWSGGS